MNLWQELAEILLPESAAFTRAFSPGTERAEDIYDGTPRLALRELASTLDGLLKPKTSNWFDITVSDERLLDDDEVLAWLADTKERMWRAVYRSDARFIQKSTEVDTSLAAFGHGVLWVEQNSQRNGLMFRSFHNAKAAIGENADGVVDQISVEEQLTPLQAERKFGRDNLGQKTIENLDRSQTRDAKQKFVQIVLPRDDRDATKIDAPNMPFVTALVDVDSEHIVDEAGYIEFPAAVPRWETAPDEVYGRSPGMMALPDARTLQAMGKTLLIGGERAVDPPIGVMNDSVMSPVRNFPGGVTVFDTTEAGNQPVFQFPVSPNIPLGIEMQQAHRQQVEQAFFRNVFRLPVDGPEMTATEIIERKEEFIRVLGPVFGRQETDYIGKTVERVFGIMMRAGAFLPMPDALQDAEIEFRYQSPIQRARKQLEIASLGQTLQQIAPMAEAKPELLDHIDGDAIMRDSPEWAGLPVKWLKSQDTVEQERQARQQQQAINEMAGAAQPVSEAVKNVAEAEKTSMETAS